MRTVELVVPSEKYLPSYLDALRRGWSPDTIRSAEAAAEEIVEIYQDPERFVAQRADDREAKGSRVKLPDGSTVERLPGFNRWLWDGDFCGSIGFRWQPGTAELPAHVLGHIGYSVVPWKRGRGYATKALALLLNEVRAEGLPYVELTADSDNLASQKVILANGGELIEEFRKPAQYGPSNGCRRYRIRLSDSRNARRYNLRVINEDLRRELLEMRAEDTRVRQELLESGELGGSYVPRMEAVHIRNASRLRELIAEYGWPDEAIAGKDGAEAAWIIVQHAIGEPEFQRQMLRLLQACADTNRVPRWHAAYLEDRISMYEGRAQRFGTQWMDDPRDGRIRPWKIAKPEQVNELRSEVGLDPLHPIPEAGPELPLEQQQKIVENQQWWERWLTNRGWRRD